MGGRQASARSYLSPYKIMRKDVADLISQYDGPDPYVDRLLFQVTSHFPQVPVEYRTRYAGAGGYTLWKSVAVWGRLATASVRPLRTWSYGVDWGSGSWGPC